MGNLSKTNTEIEDQEELYIPKMFSFCGKLFKVLLLLTTIFTRFPGQSSCRAKCSSKHTIFLQLLLFELQGMIFKGFSISKTTCNQDQSIWSNFQHYCKMGQPFFEKYMSLALFENHFNGK